MAPDQAFLGELRQRWDTDFVGATLLGRLYYDRIPSEVIATARGMHEGFDETQEIGAAVRAELEKQGIFGGSGMGFGYYDPNEFMFNATMAIIVGQRGDPRVAPAVRDCSVDVVTGRLDPFTVFEVAAGPLAAYVGILRMCAEEFAPLIRAQCLTMAALAVPRERIPGLLGIVIKNPVEAALEEATAALERKDFTLFEDKLIEAIKATTDEAGEAMTFSVLMVFSGLGGIRPLGTKVLRAAVDRVRAIDHRRYMKECVGPVALLIRACIKSDAVDEFGPELVPVVRTLLKNTTDADKEKLYADAATLLTLLGAINDAERLLSEARLKSATPDARVRLAVAAALLFSKKGDINRAVETLAGELKKTTATSPFVRREAILSLLADWPDGRSGNDVWIDEFRRLTESEDERRKSIARIDGASTLERAGKRALARRVVEGVDLARFDPQGSDSLRTKVRQLRELTASR